MMKHIIGISDENLEPFYMDWENTASHLLVGGSYQSGRTSVLRTIILSLAYTYSPKELHIVLFDASGRSLVDLKDLPHVIGWVKEEDAFAENVAHLQNELVLRREEREQNELDPSQEEKEQNFPEILFVFDDYDLAADAMGINEEILLQLGKNIRQDSHLGFHFLVSLLSGNRLHTDSLTNQLKSLRTSISLGNTDTLESLGAYVTPAMRKEQLPSGRGYFFARSGITLVQFANSDKATSDGNHVKESILSKWNEYNKAEWKNPASEEQIEQVKNASKPDIETVQEKNRRAQQVASSSYIDMDESVRRYKKQQEQIKKEEA
jgi:hypothetical protein